MSGIAGIYTLDQAPADSDSLALMVRSLALRGPDGNGQWVEGPVGLGHLMLHTTPESLDEHQPLANETGDLCVTADARIDNREELRAALQSHAMVLRDNTDAELILRAYEIWGE